MFSIFEEKEMEHFLKCLKINVDFEKLKCTKCNVFDRMLCEKHEEMKQRLTDSITITFLQVGLI